MPIRNMGTLLENIVVIESFRLILHPPNQQVDFVNSFAMPPVSQWVEHPLDWCFTAQQLAALAAGQRPDENSYGDLMWHCRGFLPQHGPNGALLCALMAGQQGRVLRMWLNDLHVGHYGDAVPGLHALSNTTNQLLNLGNAIHHQIVVCCLAYPQSQQIMRDTLNGWGGACARLGFLDPMRYVLDGRGADQTSPPDHRQWLKALLLNCPGLVLSAHFTANRGHGHLQQEIAAMHEDGMQSGYNCTLQAGHDHYRVIVSIRHPDGETQAMNVARQLQDSIMGAWRAWCHMIQHNQCALHLNIM